VASENEEVVFRKFLNSSQGRSDAVLRWIILTGAVLSGVATRDAAAQYSAISSPFNTAGSSYYENIGVNWGYRGRNFFFNNGGGTLPPFGGHDPGADAHFGFAGRGFFFNLTAGQGSSTTVGSQSATIVVPNGVPGYLFDGRQRPFVTGVIPVVGAGWAMAEEAPPRYLLRPLDEKLARLRAEPAPAPAAGRGAANEIGEVPLSASPPKDDPPLILGK
jgi:hypothetical protein